MKLTDKQQIFKNLYLTALSANLCKNQNEFAELVGLHRDTVSGALNGKEKNLTDSLISRTRLALLDKGVTISDYATSTEPQPKEDVTASDYIASINRAFDTIDALREAHQQEVNRLLDILENKRGESRSVI